MILCLLFILERIEEDPQGLIPFDPDLDEAITGPVTRSYTEEKNYTIFLCHAENLQNSIIRVSTDEKDYNLVIKKSFFLKCSDNNNGGAIFWETKGNVQLCENCIVSCHTNTMDYAGAFLYTDKINQITVNFTTVSKCGDDESNSKSAIHAFSATNHINNFNASDSHCIALYTKCSKIGYLSYSTFENNYLSDPYTAAIVYQSYSTSQYCNFIANRFPIIIFNSCLYYLNGSRDNTMSRTCFMRNVAFNLVSGTEPFTIFECTIDFGIFDSSVTPLDIRKSQSTNLLNFLHSFQCEAMFPTSSHNLHVLPFETDTGQREDPHPTLSAPSYSPNQSNQVPVTDAVNRPIQNISTKPSDIPTKDDNDHKKQTIIIATSITGSILIIIFIVIFVIYMLRKFNQSIESKEMTYTQDSTSETAEYKQNQADKSPDAIKHQHKHNGEDGNENDGDEDEYTYTEYSYSQYDMVTAESNDRDISISEVSN